MPSALKAGEPIPGSRYRRSYCRSCGDEIRVFWVTEFDECDQCRRAMPMGLLLLLEPTGSSSQDGSPLRSTG